jgi:hypothetical protein
MMMMMMTILSQYCNESNVQFQIRTSDIVQGIPLSLHYSSTALPHANSVIDTSDQYFKHNIMLKGGNSGLRNLRTMKKL